MSENARKVEQSELAMRTAQMIDMLPAREQELAFETVKRFVLAWDPDFIKLTDLEAHRVAKSEAELDSLEYVRHADIDWN